MRIVGEWKSSALMALGCWVMGLIGTNADAQTMKPVPTPELISGVQSCLTATNSKQVDTAALQKDGWSVLTVMQGKERKPVPLAPSFLGRRDILLTYNNDGPAPACIMMARIASFSEVGGLIGDLDKALRSTHASKDGKKIIPAYWFPDHHIVELATTGLAQAPSVRIAVGYRK